MDWTIRDVAAHDLDAVRALNAANVPEVGPLDEGRIERFLAEATFRVVERSAEVVGLFVALVEGSGYESPNYRWFAQRHERFAYVDRIALAPEARGTGAADALYRGFEDEARAAGRPVVCAEVNTVPANPRSSRFHARRGFIVVGELSPYGNDERVAMVEKVL